jgi:hypothetical protein
MTAIGSVRLHLSVLRASLALFLLAAGLAAAQPCPPGTTIPNFRYVSATQTFPRVITYAWDAPEGAAADTVYELLGAEAADYCLPFSAFTVIAETTARSFRVTLATPDRVYQFWVRVKGCNVAAPGSWIDDSFLLTPSAPVLAISGTTANQVTLSLTQGDSRAAAVVLERAGTDGYYRQIDSKYFYDICPAGSQLTVIDSGLAPGTYSYRAWALNQGTNQQVYSGVVTTTVSGTSELPPVVDFYSASPGSVRPGDPSTLSWASTGGNSATIDQGVGPVATSGSVVVHPTRTTTYTLVVTGTGGASVSRVQVAVTPAAVPGEVAGTVVTVVSSPGLYGSYYRTAVQLSNPSASLAIGRLVYHPKERSGSAGDSFLRYTLQAHQTLEFPNVLALIGTSGNGSLDVVPEGGAVPVVRARVYNDAGPLGTTGVTEYGLPPADSLKAGDTGVLIAPANSRRFRFSIGLRTLDTGATLSFTLRDASGVVLKAFTATYPATYYIQRPAPDLFDGATFTADESVTVEVISGSAFVYATVADNITNDPSMQIARRLP